MTYQPEERGYLAVPPTDLPRSVVTALEQCDIVVALGGSGLLAAFELTDNVHDWDLTTDAAPYDVEAALLAASLNYIPNRAGDSRFATKARFLVMAEGQPSVDLIVGFAIRVGDEIVRIPTHVSGYWNGLPLGDPLMWAKAYRLIGRPEKASALETWMGRCDFPDISKSSS